MGKLQWVRGSPQKPMEIKTWGVLGKIMGIPADTFGLGGLGRQKAEVRYSGNVNCGCGNSRRLLGAMDGRSHNITREKCNFKKSSRGD